MTQLPDQLRRFHAAITGAAPLETARSLVEDGAVDALTRLHVYAHAYTARIANVLVGIAGSSIGYWIAGMLGMSAKGGILGFLVAIAGAALLIFILRALGIFKKG